MSTNGFIVYDGPSLIGDKSPIIAIVTGTNRKTKNRKTGDLLQLWIIPRNVSPVTALVNRRNSGVCGNCPLQGDSFKGLTCYVNVGQAPKQVWNTYRRGSYPALSPAQSNHLLRGRKIRLGAYGDPAAIPIPILRRLVRYTISQT